MQIIHVDAELIALLKAKDEKTIESLVRENTKYLLYMTRKYGIGKDLEGEAIQNTWETFISKVDNFEGRSKVRTYLTGILFNKIRELRRSEGKHKAEGYSKTDVYDGVWENKFDSSGSWIVKPDSPEDFSLKAETMDIINNCLDALPENQKMVFSLKEVDGVSNSEISKMLNQSISNIGVLLFRAKNKLRDCISVARSL